MCVPQVIDTQNEFENYGLGSITGVGGKNGWYQNRWLPKHISRHSDLGSNAGDTLI